MSVPLDELMRYVGWSPEDTARLRALEPTLRPRFRAMADHFYQVVERHPRAVAVFTGPAQIARLKDAMVDWMVSGLLGPHDDAFYDKRSRIGKRHVAIGLAQEYMFTAVNVLRLDYHEALGELVAPAALVVTIASVDKLFDLELAIMLRHYQLASEARLVDRERRIQEDKLIAMQTLSAGLAHEVRNPLNAAKLQLELLDRRLRRASEDDRLHETVALIEHEIERLTRLLNEFLAFAQPPKLATAPRDLIAVVREVLELERPHADAGSVKVVVTGDELPVLANVDGARLLQVIQALVRNAIESTPPGGQVVIDVARTDRGPQLRVIDRGRGIAPGMRDRIFEPFFSTKPDRTGMGLALVHSLVSAHTGTVEVETAPGRGATFTVTLPPA